MNRLIITTLQNAFEDCAQEAEGVEFWFARDLQNLLGYVEWRKFQGVIEKAKESCKNSGYNVNDHFVGAAKTIDMPKGATKEITNFNVKQNNLHGEAKITDEHVKNNAEMRQF